MGAVITTHKWDRVSGVRGAATSAHGRQPTPDRSAHADVGGGQCPADPYAARPDAGAARRAGGSGTENDPALGDRCCESNGWPGRDGGDGTRCECVDAAPTGEAAPTAGRPSPATSAAGHSLDLLVLAVRRQTRTMSGVFLDPRFSGWMIPRGGRTARQEGSNRCVVVGRKTS